MSRYVRNIRQRKPERAILVSQFRMALEPALTRLVLVARYEFCEQFLAAQFPGLFRDNAKHSFLYPAAHDPAAQ